MTIVRPNQLIVEGHEQTKAVYDYAQHPTIHLFDPQDKTAAAIYDHHGEWLGEVAVERVAQELIVKLTGIQQASLQIHTTAGKTSHELTADQTTIKEF